MIYIFEFFEDIFVLFSINLLFTIVLHCLPSIDMTTLTMSTTASSWLRA